MPAGRPLTIKTAEEMEALVEAYFAKCKEEERPPTVCGLALALGMTRASLCNYEKRDEFFDTIKRAKQRVEDSLETLLLSGKNATGPIFNLKNNFGWKDTSTTVHSGTVNLKLNVGFD